MFYGEVGLFCITAAIMLVAAIIDRFGIQRGAVSDIDTALQGTQSGHLLFRFDYLLKGNPSWSEIDYSLHDSKNPTTIISGQKRNLNFSVSGKNSEYLIIPADFISEGRWILKIKVTTTAGRFNPLYSIFPTTITHSHEVEI